MLVLLAGGFYGAACGLPAVQLGPAGTQGGQPAFGYQGLILGWMPPFTIAWSANLFFLAGIVLLVFGKLKPAAACGWLAVLAGLTTHILAEAALTGYFCWMGALLILAIGPWGVSEWLDCDARETRFGPTGLEQ